MLTADQYRGLYAIIPTPAIPKGGGGGLDVNLPETARVADRLIRDGAQGLIALGTTGECATLSSNEFSNVATCLAEAVAGRVPLFVGATALGTKEVFSRIEELQTLGVTGSLLGLPMWQPLTVDMAVKFYADVSREYSDFSLMVYANQRAFRFPFGSSSEFWSRVSEDAPTVTSAKVSKLDDYTLLRQISRGKINFMPSDMSAHVFSTLAPGGVTACWATAASMGPAPSLALIDAIAAGEDSIVDEVAKDIEWANEPILPIVAQPEVFASYNIQMEKVRIAAAGYCDPGPIRPPYDVIPDDYRRLAEQAGQRWREIQIRYRGDTRD